MLKEEKTVTQISSEHEVHSSQLYKWRAQALEGLHNLFDNNKTEKAQQSDQERKLNELYP
jgi:transposase-like protein